MHLLWPPLVHIQTRRRIPPWPLLLPEGNTAPPIPHRCLPDQRNGSFVSWDNLRLKVQPGRLVMVRHIFTYVQEVTPDTVFHLFPYHHRRHDHMNAATK